MAADTRSWRLSEKIAFRFFFLLLSSFSIFCWDNTFQFSFHYEFDAPYKFLAGPFYWLDKHIYHSGYDPKFHVSFPGDNHFGLVCYLTLLLLSITGTVIWSWLDRRRPSYDRFLYWFRVYIRYVLAVTMFTYGIDKLIPTQMPYPGVIDQLTPLGEFTRFNVLWNFMGVAPGYMVLTGTMEILGSLLLLFRRTVAAGCLILLVMLVNIVSINIFYNVQVKSFSTQLLIYCLFLLYPYLKNIIAFFFLGKPVSLAERHYRLSEPARHNSLFVVLLLIFVFGTLAFGIEANSRHRQHIADGKRERSYDVTAFVAKDTLPPLETDTLRWKRCLFASSHYPPFMSFVVIFNMRGEKDYYACVTDSTEKKIIFKDEGDSLKWPVFHYSYPARDRLLLIGKWKGRDVNIYLQNRPIDSTSLNREEIKWMRD
jgi:hypothetical protein